MWTQWLLGILVLAAIIGLVYANLQFARFLPGGSEFLAHWTAASGWLREGLNPYLPEMMLRVQEKLYGRAADPQQGEIMGAYLHPFPSLFLYVPFSLVPYPIARAIWMTLLEISLPLTAALSLIASRSPSNRMSLVPLLLFSVLWLPGLLEILTGGSLPLVVLLISGAMYALRKENDPLAGILLGLSLFIPWVSFPAVLFISFWSMSVRRWQTPLWTLAISGSLTILSILLQPDWVQWWLIQLVMVAKHGGLSTGVGLLQSSATPLTRFIPWIVGIAILAYLLFEWFLASRKMFRWGMWTMAVTTVMTIPIIPVLGQEAHVLLIPAISLVIALSSERWGRMGRKLGLALLLLLLSASWLIELRVPLSHFGRLLATWSAPSMLLVCLWWVRWGITHRSLQMIEQDW